MVCKKVFSLSPNSSRFVYLRKNELRYSRKLAFGEDILYLGR